MERVASANEEAIRAWDGVLFDRFVAFRPQVVEGLTPHGEEALRWAPPRPGDRVLDIGCGFGDTSQRLSELVGETGSVLGVDVSPRFIEAARSEAEAAGVSNLRFDVVDVQAMDLGERFDYAFSRFGTMFFANPVVAMRNVCHALEPGGRLCMVVWRRKLDNPWLHRAETVVKPLVPEPDETDEPTCGPGPFSMADADTTSHILVNAGFQDVALRRCDLPFWMGPDLDEAIAYNMALGPAGEAIRLAGEAAEQVRPQLISVLREVLSEFVTQRGVVGDSSTWIVTARTPQG